MPRFLKNLRGKPYVRLLAKSAAHYSDLANREFAPNSANWGMDYLSHLTHWPAACLKGFVRVRLDCTKNVEAQSIDFQVIFQGANCNLQGATP